MKRIWTSFVFTILVLFSGLAMGFLLGNSWVIEPRIEKSPTVINLRKEVEIYRKRCVDWSHYVWNIQHEDNRQQDYAHSLETK